MHLPLLSALWLLNAAVQGAPDHPLERALAEAMHADASRVGLVLVFDDVHPLWGGALFELAPDGQLTRTDVPPAQQAPVTSSTQLDASDRAALLALLMGLEAWEQRVPDRIPVPGESRAYLGVRLEDAETSIWEWANDLPDNKRLYQVERWLDARLPAGAP
jgi:hypothetical protein